MGALTRASSFTVHQAPASRYFGSPPERAPRRSSMQLTSSTDQYGRMPKENAPVLQFRSGLRCHNQNFAAPIRPAPSLRLQIVHARYEDDEAVEGSANGGGELRSPLPRKCQGWS